MMENCGIVDPPPGDRRQHRRHDPGQQHDRADERLERDVVVEQHRQPQPEREFPDRRDGRVEDRVGHRHPEHRIVRQRDEILQADEMAGLADRGVGDRQPEAEAERIGQEDQQQPGRRQHAQRDQECLVVEQPGQPAVRLAGRTDRSAGSTVASMLLLRVDPAQCGLRRARRASSTPGPPLAITAASGRSRSIVRPASPPA